MKNTLQRHLKENLIKNAGEVLQKLRAIFALNARAFNDVILLAARLEKYQHETKRGLLIKTDENQQFREITDGVLELIDTISDEEAAAYDLENAVFKRILVVCKSAGRESYMRQLFPAETYKGIEFDISEQPRPADSANQFDLIVFDNSPHGEKDDPQSLLLYYLTNTEPYLLYFGENLPLLWKYPDKAYFANSRFSLHSRLNEMMTFLKFFKA